ncbi:transmembrane protein, putative [Medicago truncatula]|uniref:Transmembrane protein, putative n=1 Tax=Medicago truncatula TaxID=3880 RepID=G8A145_MEDTR|nr:transmembrane protein, putative [Medicago truncatula]
MLTLSFMFFFFGSIVINCMIYNEIMSFYVAVTCSMVFKCVGIRGGKERGQTEFCKD